MRTFALFLLLVTLFSFLVCSCGGGGDSANTNGASSNWDEMNWDQGQWS